MFLDYNVNEGKAVCYGINAANQFALILPAWWQTGPTRGLARSGAPDTAAVLRI